MHMLALLTAAAVDLRYRVLMRRILQINSKSLLCSSHITHLHSHDERKQLSLLRLALACKRSLPTPEDDYKLPRFAIECCVVPGGAGLHTIHKTETCQPADPNSLSNCRGGACV